MLFLGLIFVTTLIMKKILFAFIICLSFSNVFAGHISGGEMFYEYLGPGAAAGTSKYRITLRLYKDTTVPGTPGVASMPGSVNIGIYNNDNNAQYPSANSPYAVNLSNYIYPVLINPIPPCMENPPTIKYCLGVYVFIVDLPNNLNGYTITYQVCCRISGIANVPNNTGSNYSCKTPGSFQLSNAEHNSSPQFRSAIDIICDGNNFTLDFSATDADGDQLTYSFCNAYDGGVTSSGSPVATNPGPPPFNSVTYTGGYSASSPLGNSATINTNTGIISGIAPPAGKYVVCVCINETRNGVVIASHRKDFIVTVSQCNIVEAKPPIDFVTCGDFLVQFTNGSTGNIVDSYWNFGDPATLADTSHQVNPSYQYPDTGVYHVMLIVRNSSGCIDTGYTTVGVYPGFFPGFINSTPLCVNVPIQFTDTTYTRYGTTTGWRWDFGNPAVLNDTSHLPTPIYSYPAAGTYTVEFIVANTKGCRDTVYKNIVIGDPPPLNLFPGDTTYCGLDSLQLTATGIGNFNWTPNSFILGSNTGTPIVFPPLPTQYIVTLDNNGCVSKDSLIVTPKLDLTNSIAASSTTICEEDTLTLTGNSNYLNVSWQWSPIASLANPTAKVTRAFPIINTTYQLLTTWGLHCTANTSIPIVVRPLAIPEAGPDALICSGQGSAQLTASGGNSYQWTPTTGLNNPNIPNPIASPAVTTVYKVAVGVTGCSRTRIDSATVTVSSLPIITLINDTLICSIDTLQLNAGGVGNFVWSPNYMISSLTIPNPLVSPDQPTKYYVRLTDAIGCFNDDSIFVDVKQFVTIDAGNDTTICRTDGFLLNTNSDALHYIWTPATYLDDPTKKHPFTTPLTNTMYHVIGNIGKCQNEDSILIKVVPYPSANAGPDKAICPGFNIQLQATGGSSYAWTPSTFLNNRFIPNPIALNPTASIRYIVTVMDTLGCPKAVKDTVFVTLYPTPIADAGPRDTSIVEGQPLQLNGSGGNSYLWSPPQWLSNIGIPNPIALPQASIEYVLEATSSQGCKDYDSILVRLFKVDPDMYVPNAFTPNGDGLNDVIRPILLGMKELRYFKIFNRFGQMVFYTTDIGRGWDGNYAGRGQDPGNFVWVAEGITYKGEVKQKKGNVILIRQ